MLWCHPASCNSTNQSVAFLSSLVGSELPSTSRLPSSSYICSWLRAWIWVSLAVSFSTSWFHRSSVACPLPWCSLLGSGKASRFGRGFLLIRAPIIGFAALDISLIIRIVTSSFSYRLESSAVMSRYLVRAIFRPSVGTATSGTNIIDRTAIILRHDDKGSTVFYSNFKALDCCNIKFKSIHSLGLLFRPIKMGKRGFFHFFTGFPLVKNLWWGDQRLPIGSV